MDVNKKKKILPGLPIAALHTLDSIHNTVSQWQNTELHADTYVNQYILLLSNDTGIVAICEDTGAQSRDTEPKQNMDV